MTKYVLWPASWYPGKTDAFNGDFIERHAKAVASFIPVVVIFVTKDESLSPGETVIEKTGEGNLVVYRGYYGPSQLRFTEKAHSFFNYFFLQKRIFSRVKKKWGIPVLTHVQVVYRAGIFARYLKSVYKIPYIISEHWSAYYLKSPNSVYDLGFPHLNLIKWILKGAKLVLPVAEKLSEAINHLVPVQTVVIPNVVDTEAFFYRPKIQAKIIFIHVSTMNYVKNPRGIVRAAIELHKEGFDFEMRMMGSLPEELISLAKTEDALNNYIFFKNEMSYLQIALEMQQASALVLFSRFESLPCVILEAFCCGLPVISSGVGGIGEIVNPSNGILVESENQNQLVEAMKRMIIDYSGFDRKDIAREATSTFSYSTVGARIFRCYQQVLNNQTNLG